MHARALFPLLPIAVTAVLAALPCARPATAQAVQRCTDASGSSVFTDRRCEDVGAASRVIRPRLDASRQADAPVHPGCPRRLSELVQRITGAIDAGDANRLAALYQWSGISDASANRLLDRMEIIVRRPLVDIAPIFPAAEPEPIVDADGAAIDADTEDSPAGQSAMPRKRRPIGLRLRQGLANTSTPSSTALGIRRSNDCFWITL